jgi:arylsulfatase A-like enzyme
MNQQHNQTNALSERRSRKAGLLTAFSLLLAAPMVTVSVAGCRRDQKDLDHPKAKTPRPDIIFIMIDTLRADHLGCYGHERSENSPVIDSIAAEGVMFEHAITAAPWTQPSIASIFTSVYPGVHKVINYGQAFAGVYGDAKRVTVLQDSFVTLAEVLGKGGYATAGFVANPFILEDFGFAQGFDHFDSSFAKIAAPGSLVNESMNEWLRDNPGDKPMFLYLHYMEPHGPYDALPQFMDPLLDKLASAPVLTMLSKADLDKMTYLLRMPTEATNPQLHESMFRFREYWLARYDAAVRQVDHFVGQVRDTLRDMGRWDDALVIVASDHGEAFGEHGFWEHGYSMHHTDLHVPLIMRWPKNIEAGVRVEGWVRLIDVMPTLLDFVRLDAPEDIQGVSLAEVIREQHVAGVEPALSESMIRGPEQKALYAGGWKLIARVEEGGQELYHIVQDVDERNELSGERPEHVSTLDDLLKRQLEDNADRARGITPKARDLTPEQLKRLRELGYIGD